MSKVKDVTDQIDQEQEQEVTEVPQPRVTFELNRAFARSDKCVATAVKHDPTELIDTAGYIHHRQLIAEMIKAGEILEDRRRIAYPHRGSSNED